MVLRIYILFSILFCAVFTNAQQPVFRQFDIRAESSRPKITKLFLDRSGKIWTGTDHGLFNFDGIDFHKIQGTDSSIYQSVNSIFEDRTGIIWAGFSNGKIIQVILGKASRYNPEEGFPKTAVTAFSEDEQGRIYFTTKGEGVYCVERGRMYNINEDDGLSDNFCYTLVKLQDGRMCVATDAGLNFVRFRNGKKEVSSITTGNDLPDDIIRDLLPDGKGNLWIAMQDKGITLLDLKTNKLTNPLKENWKYGAVSHLLFVDDELWISTEEHGILIYKDGTLVQYPLDLGKAFTLSDIITDLENNVWMCESIHLIRTSGNKIRILTTLEGLHIKFVHCILADHEGNIWFTPDEQLAKITFLPNGKLKLNQYSVLPSTNKAAIVTLYEDPYGYIWAGTLGAGVLRINPHTGKAITIQESKSVESASILSITGSKNEIWFGGFNGVNKYKIVANGNSDNAIIKKDETFKVQGKLASDYVYSVFIDSKNTVWLGTDENGAYHITGETIKNIGVPGNTVHSFAEDKQGRIWMSTADAGIVVYSNDSIGMIEPKDGLSDPGMTSLLCTDSGNIVMVYANGFDIYETNTGRIIYHSTEENLYDINCDLNSITRGKNGMFYIGSERGIIFYTTTADLKLKQPKVILNSVFVFLEDIDFSKNNEFESDENNLRFNFSGLWYSDPQRINYSYLLNGYSTKWQETKDHFITFPKLPPGKYEFKLRASLNNTFSKSEEVTYAFTIQLPIWQRWWFRIIVAALVATFIVLFIKRRENRLRKYDRIEKEKIEFQFETLRSQVNPHFLFNSFNTLITVIEKNPPLAVEYVEKLSEFFRSIINYRDKNAIPLIEEIELLENYIFIQKKRYGDNLQVINKISKESEKMFAVPPLSLQLLAENAIKHNAVSKETPLLITLYIENKKLTVSNNINKKISSESSSGLGLPNIINRYKLLSDESIDIDRNELYFSVSIPLLSN